MMYLPLIILVSTVVGVTIGWLLHARLRLCGPLLRVPDGAMAHVKLGDGCEIFPGFAKVVGTGELLIEFSDGVRMAPGKHDMRNITLRGSDER